MFFSYLLLCACMVYVLRSQPKSQNQSPANACSPPFFCIPSPKLNCLFLSHTCSYFPGRAWSGCTNSILVPLMPKESVAPLIAVLWRGRQSQVSPGNAGDGHHLKNKLGGQQVDRKHPAPVRCCQGRAAPSPIVTVLVARVAANPVFASLIVSPLPRRT